MLEQDASKVSNGLFSGSHEIILEWMWSVAGDHISDSLYHYGTIADIYIYIYIYIYNINSMLVS